MSKPRSLLILLFAVAALAAGSALAALDQESASMVLDRGESWQLALDQREYHYVIEYLDGDMFVTVAANFLDERNEVVHTSTHTLVQDKRMSAEQSFQADKVADIWRARAVRFECDAGRVRITLQAL